MCVCHNGGVLTFAKQAYNGVLLEPADTQLLCLPAWSLLCIWCLYCLGSADACLVLLLLLMPLSPSRDHVMTDWLLLPFRATARRLSYVRTQDGPSPPAAHFGVISRSHHVLAACLCVLRVDGTGLDGFIR